MKYNLLNGSNLAYIGDAYFELEIRKYLLSKNITKNKDLRKISIYYVSASAHFYIVSMIEEMFTEEEKAVFLRGRNGAPSGRRKNVNRNEYLVSSGFEAVIGYLYLKEDFDRLNFIMNQAIKVVEEKYDNLW